MIYSNQRLNSRTGQTRFVVGLEPVSHTTSTLAGLSLYYTDVLAAIIFRDAWLC